MKKHLSIIFLIAFLIVMLILIMLVTYSCSSSDKSSATEMMDRQEMAYELAEKNNSYYDGGAYEPEAVGAIEADYYDYQAPAQMQSVSSVLPADRKIIRDASLSLQADSVEETYNKILVLMSDLGGYESSRDMSGEGKSTYIRATIKIPAGNLDLFLNDAKGTGKLISSYISSSDITDEYFDSQTRLTTLEKTLEKYYEFLDNATKISDQLEISNQISDITYQIESLKGRLRKWDSLVEYSTVSIYVSATPEIIVETREIKWNSLSFDDVKYLAASGLVRFAGAIVSMLQWVLIIAVTLSPVAVPMAVVIVILVMRSRKKKRQMQLLKDKEKEKEKNIDSSND